MTEMIAWIAAQAEPRVPGNSKKIARSRRPLEERTLIPQFPAHNFLDGTAEAGLPTSGERRQQEEEDREEERRTYRSRTIGMLRRYMRHSIETGRLPSLLGREFFRSKVTSYTVVTFEDRVIFVHDMESCLAKLDDFSRQLLARHILQEHDQAATGRLLHCTERTVRTYIPVALDLLTEILLDAGLMERLASDRRNACQEGENDVFAVSDCEDEKNKV